MSGGLWSGMRGLRRGGERGCEFKYRGEVIFRRDSFRWSRIV